jgi:hypothetical protein
LPFLVAHRGRRRQARELAALQQGKYQDSWVFFGPVEREVDPYCFARAVKAQRVRKAQ